MPAGRAATKFLEGLSEVTHQDTTRELQKVKIFIIWSGERSKALAEALNDWLPNVIQAVDPWMSESGIDKGARWPEVLFEKLENTNFGIVCLTPENLSAEWLLFEAGALSKKVEGSRICPLLFDLDPSELGDPLALFQTTKLNAKDVCGLLNSINKAMDAGSLDASALNAAFDKWWPDLEEKIEAIGPLQTPTPPKSTDPNHDILKEILKIVRSQARENWKHMDSIRARFRIDEPDDDESQEAFDSAERRIQSALRKVRFRR